MKCRKLTAAVLAAAMFAGAPFAVERLQNVSVVANADDERVTEGDWTYTVNADGTTVMINRYDGTDTDIVIPETLGGKTVTIIDDWGCPSNVTSVTIPSGVTEIYCYFSNRENLEAFIVDDNNATFSSLDGVLFNKAKTTLIVYPCAKAGDTYTIPDGVTEF